MIHLLTSRIQRHHCYTALVFVHLRGKQRTSEKVRVGVQEGGSSWIITHGLDMGRILNMGRQVYCSKRRKYIWDFDSLVAMAGKGARQWRKSKGGHSRAETVRTMSGRPVRISEQLTCQKSLQSHILWPVSCQSCRLLPPLPLPHPHPRLLPPPRLLHHLL